LGLVDQYGRPLVSAAPSGYAGADVDKHLTIAPYARTLRFGLSPGPKRGSKMLRSYADRNEWVRIAINRRKRELGRAKWQIVRVDDHEEPADPRVVAAVTDLFRSVNLKGESFRTLLDLVIEDLLILDAGCIEKSKTLGGQIYELTAVDGSTIVIDPTWDGSDPKRPRYAQYDNFKLVCELRNDELIYMMLNPSTHRVTGLSPVETLVRVIEAELYGEEYDFSSLRATAPEGVLDIGRGLTDQQVDRFRAYYDEEIAGTKNVAIFGGGEPGAGSGVTFTPFKDSNRDQQRMEYKKWLAGKIAACFEMDKTMFGLTEDTNRSTSKTTNTKSDEGLIGLATAVQEFITREIVWEFDRKHGFEFEGIVARDELVESQIDATYLDRGAVTVNEWRASTGRDPVAWGDVPFVPGVTSITSAGKVQDPVDPAAAVSALAGGPDGSADSEKPPKGDAKDSLPFRQRHLRKLHDPLTVLQSFGYLENSTA